MCQRIFLSQRNGTRHITTVVLHYQIKQMATNQTIAIIDAIGTIGSAMAKKLASGPYRLVLMGEDLTKLTGLKHSIGENNPDADIELITCATDACWEADIIILAVPYKDEISLIGKIKEVATGKIVVSISDTFYEANEILLTSNLKSIGEKLQELLPNSKVVKAFSMNYASKSLVPVISGIELKNLIGGNDNEALETVSLLFKHAGFNPIITGVTPVGLTLESM